MSDAGFEDVELMQDIGQMDKLLNIIHTFFVNSGLGEEALIEALMDGLGYVYVCRRKWHKSTLLMSIEPELKTAVRSQAVAKAVEEFYSAAEDTLEPVVRAFARMKLSQQHQRRLLGQ